MFTRQFGAAKGSTCRKSCERSAGTGVQLPSAPVSQAVQTQGVSTFDTRGDCNRTRRADSRERPALFSRLRGIEEHMSYKNRKYLEQYKDSERVRQKNGRAKLRKYGERN